MCIPTHVWNLDTYYLGNYTLPPLCCIATACQHSFTQIDKYFSEICECLVGAEPTATSAGAASIAQENIGVYSGRGVPLKGWTQLHQSLCGCQMHRSPNADILDKVRLKKLEAGVGVLFPVLDVSSCKNQLLHWTLQLEVGAVLSEHEAALQVRDFSIGLFFCRMLWFSLWFCNNHLALRQVRGRSK